MSSATKKKHVIAELLQAELRCPHEDEAICRIVACPGNNLHEVEDGEGTRFLVSMPNKFRKVVFMKRNDIVLIKRIDEGGKVKGEIVTVCKNDHIKYYKTNNVWPVSFE
ncbi:probable RNA-binding protein EIF1AD [Nilaparvata lugens]|uniref:probable RNA-binding protein EIF1AD n=1 Tax=Nilaparvata lugens TaxID=108931 RepID=UPI000B990BD8|nr:probable RNA-binding protein EIF1AD [Nilaparvata lugens]